MPELPRIDKTHLTANAPNGDALAMVTFSNGRCGITRNGNPIPGMEWDVGEMAACTAELIRLRGDGSQNP